MLLRKTKYLFKYKYDKLYSLALFDHPHRIRVILQLLLQMWLYVVSFNKKNNTYTLVSHKAEHLNIINKQI